MATAFPDSELEIIKCSICMKIYQTPKYLPCFHTFCETCLRQYVTSVLKTSSTDAEVNKPKGFPCPICRFDVPVSNPCLTPEDIVSKLPSNHLMVTLLDQHRLTSKNKLCDPCLLLEEQNTAVSWCTVCNEALCPSCDKYHRVMKVSNSHKICPIEKMQSETKTITTLEVCKQHEEEKVKLYCMDHEQPCCAVCVTVHHRKCEQVKTLNDAAKAINESPEIKELTESLKTMIDELSDILEDRQLNLQQLEKDKKQYQDKIAKMRQDINKHLDLLEETANQELDGRYKETSILIGNDIAEIESHLKVLSNYKNLFDNGLKNVSDIHKFLETNKLKQQHAERSEQLKKLLGEMKNHEIKIQFEDSWANLKSTLTSIGTVTVNSTPLESRSGIIRGITKPLDKCTARKTHEFSSTGNSIVNGIFLPNDKMLLVDYYGCKIIFCSLDGRVEKELSLSHCPFGIAQLNVREAAVVLYGTQYIQYIDIENCTLGNLITVNKTLSRGIGYTGTNLIVGGSDRNIYMIDKAGNIIKTVASGHTAQYITCTTDRIYLTSDDNKMVCLDMNGSLIFSYTNSNFREGEGISVDREGNIYCCGYSSHNIHQLTPDGQFIKQIVTGIHSPWGITFDNGGERFLVTHYPNKVTVYELQQ